MADSDNNTKRTAVRVAKDGTLQPCPTGRASAELLPEHMRKLPGDLVTKHEAEADKVHELDEPHIVGALVYERQKAEKAEAANTHGARLAELREQMKRVPLGESAPLSQARIDIERFHAGRATLAAYNRKMDRGEAVDIDQRYHLWFPTDDVQVYQLRPGNAPADQDRPRHMQGYTLAVDPLCPPAWIRAAFRRADIMLTDGRAAMESDQVARDDD